MSLRLCTEKRCSWFISYNCVLILKPQIPWLHKIAIAKSSNCSCVNVLRWSGGSDSSLILIMSILFYVILLHLTVANYFVQCDPWHCPTVPETPWACFSSTSNILDREPERSYQIYMAHEHSFHGFQKVCHSPASRNKQ